VFEQFERLRKPGAGDCGKVLLEDAAGAADVEDRARIDEVLETIGLQECGWGVRARCRTPEAMARDRDVLMQQPELLLVDEPVAGMTP